MRCPRAARRAPSARPSRMPVAPASAPTNMSAIHSTRYTQLNIASPGGRAAATLPIAETRQKSDEIASAAGAHADVLAHARVTCAPNAHLLGPARGVQRLAQREDRREDEQRAPPSAAVTTARGEAEAAPAGHADAEHEREAEHGVASAARRHTLGHTPRDWKCPSCETPTRGRHARATGSTRGAAARRQEHAAAARPAPTAPHGHGDGGEQPAKTCIQIPAIFGLPAPIACPQKMPSTRPPMSTPVAEVYRSDAAAA